MLKFENLCDFRIGGGLGLTFNGGILPLLQHFAHSLTSLSFECHSSVIVNIRAIIENCPNLQLLNISNCNVRSSARKDEQNPPKRIKTSYPVLGSLKTLKFKCCDLTSEDFDSLLASPALEVLELNFIRLSIDDSFRKAEILHQFRNLQSLACTVIDITKADIDLLMNDGNSLKKIQIVGCRKLSLEDVHEWERVAREKTGMSFSLV